MCPLDLPGYLPGYPGIYHGMTGCLSGYDQHEQVWYPGTPENTPYQNKPPVETPFQRKRMRRTQPFQGAATSLYAIPMPFSEHGKP